MALQEFERVSRHWLLQRRERREPAGRSHRVPDDVFVLHQEDADAATSVLHVWSVARGARSQTSGAFPNGAPGRHPNSRDFIRLGVALCLGGVPPRRHSGVHRANHWARFEDEGRS